MVVLTHGPETCAAAHPEPGEMADEAIARIDEVAKKHGIAVQGWWVDAPGHTFFILTDAPDAHTVNKLMIELRLFHWNTVTIHLIVPVKEAEKLVARA